MPLPHRVAFAFDSFVLDATERRLTREGRDVPLTPKLFDTLELLVRHPDRLIEKSEFMTRLWPDTFVSDVTLAHNISALRKVLGSGQRASYIETVPKRGYRFIARVVALPDGPRAVPPAPAALGARPSGPWARSASLLILGIMTIATVAWVASTRAGGRSPSATIGSPVSVAILPFETLGAGDQVLEIGVADTLIAKLSRIPAVAVRPLSAVRGYTSHQSASAIGRTLQVDFVLEGTIQHADGRIRVTPHLVRVSDGAVVWSAPIEDGADSLLAIQDSLAARLAVALVPRLNPESRARLATRETTNPAAQRAYLQGRYLWGRRTAESLKSAAAYMEEAVRLDPSYAVAYAGLADAYVLLPGYSGVISDDEAIPKARAAAERAIALDPFLAGPNATLGLIAMNYDWSWSDAERLYRHAIELDPNYATAHAWLGEFLGYMGRFDEGIAEMRRAHDLDPASLIIATDLGKVLMLSRQYDAAVAQFTSVLEVDGSFWAARAWRSAAYWLANRDELAVREFDDPSNPGDEGTRLMRAALDAHAGRSADARALLRALAPEKRKEYISAYWPAIAYGYLREADQAFYWLNFLCDKRAPGVISLRVDPQLDPLRGDPRFDALLRRVGLSP